ncbi:type II toxin-antitoxin system RelE/ParE family toxin [Candidatus Woesearchaeota archaeon]|nr:type II toxin-antitoxin system RelE/ParE family toxin [Candidatus Woesearchaeota archaeon]
MFRVFLGSPAKKFLKKCEKIVRARILSKIKRLSVNPYPPDSKRVVGRKEKTFRVRMGDYRILYVVFYDENELLISEIDKRARVY